jgi:hypothetical protein
MCGVQDLSRCDELDDAFRQWGVFPNISAQGLRLPCLLDEVSGGGNDTEPWYVHLYAGVQIVKKMHPIFDM